MKLKDEILNYLYSAQGGFLSGEQLAAMCGVSRNAVWKAVNALKDAGFAVDAVTNKGYRLSAEDVFIPSLTGLDASQYDVLFYRKTDSTNTRLKALAEEGAREGTVAVALEQTAGRGRKGRNFCSPDSGIYISFLLRPAFGAEEVSLLTVAAAVAAARTVDFVTGKNSGIKWVNDIYTDGRKVCGILSEAALSVESRNVDYAIVGTGINLYKPQGGFPDEIKNVAGWLFDKPVKNLKNIVVKKLTDEFFGIYRNFADKSFFDEYRAKSIITGKTVSVVKSDRTLPAYVLRIDDACRLEVKHENGETELLSSGEISVKL